MQPPRPPPPPRSSAQPGLSPRPSSPESVTAAVCADIEIDTITPPLTPLVRVVGAPRHRPRALRHAVDLVDLDPELPKVLERVHLRRRVKRR
jgi:hypothetical protein